MEFTPENRPALSRDLYKPSHLWALLYLSYSLCLYAVPAYSSYLVATSEIALHFKVVAVLLLSIMSAYGLNMMGFTGHEGTHGSLFRNKKLSAIVGIFYASAVLTYFEMGFAMSHWNHHRYTNQKDDPDIAPVKNLKKWWQRLLFSRYVYNKLYFKYTWLMALGKPNPFKYKMAYPVKDQILFARLNFLFALMWITFYGWLFYLDPLLGLFSVALPMLTVNFVGACQIYIDHAGLDDKFLQNAYSRTSPLMTLLFFGANYHLEHHAYPGVPCYRLPKVHKILVENGTYEKVKPPLVPGFFQAFKAMTLPYEGGDVGYDFDAFEEAYGEEPHWTK